MIVTPDRKCAGCTPHAKNSNESRMIMWPEKRGAERARHPHLSADGLARSAEVDAASGRTGASLVPPSISNLSAAAEGRAMSTRGGGGTRMRRGAQV
jgi:hypothetical protein